QARFWRPHPVRLVEELLDAPLPDYPVTYLSDWGIPAPFPGCAGQVLNVWAEMLPGLMRTAEVAQTKGADGEPDGEAIWHPNSGNRLIQFLGYDNSFFFAVVHLALAMASRGRCILPTAIITNEFYQLDNFKFSTSKNHAIWARDLLDRRPVDEVRFYLAFGNPEFQKANFTQAEMDKLVAEAFVRPWQQLVAAIALFDHSQASNTAELSGEGRALVAGLIASFERYYKVEAFSMQRIAELFSQLLGWLGHFAKSVAQRQHNGRQGSQELATVWTILGLLPALVGPLLPDFARRLDAALGQDTCGRWPNGGLPPANAAPAAKLESALPPRHPAHVDE